MSNFLLKDFIVNCISKSNPQKKQTYFIILRLLKCRNFRIFTVTQILREINLWESKKFQKIAILSFLMT